MRARAWNASGGEMRVFVRRLSPSHGRRPRRRGAHHAAQWYTQRVASTAVHMHRTQGGEAIPRAIVHLDGLPACSLGATTHGVSFGSRFAAKVTDTCHGMAWHIVTQARLGAFCFLLFGFVCRDAVLQNWKILARELHPMMSLLYEAQC